MQALAGAQGVLADPLARTLLAAVVLALIAAPLGVIVVARRLSLIGDAVAHGMAPGIAIAGLWTGFDAAGMAFGGLIAGAGVAILASVLARRTPQHEDSALAALYLTALAAGLALLAAHGADDEVLHVLFGPKAAVSLVALWIILAAAGVVGLGLAAIWGTVVAEAASPGYVRGGALAHGAFLALVVVTLVAGFQALGSILSVGLMILPAAAARLWARRLWGQVATAAAIGVGAGGVGALVAARLGIGPGPAVILAAGAAYAVSILLGPAGGLLRAPSRSPAE